MLELGDSVTYTDLLWQMVWRDAADESLEEVNHFYSQLALVAKLTRTIGQLFALYPTTETHTFHVLTRMSVPRQIDQNEQEADAPTNQATWCGRVISS